MSVRTEEDGVSGVAFRLNGRAVTIQASPTLPLADLLRDGCGLTSVKIGCSRAVCGSCTVLVDGRPAASCALFAFHAEGTEVTTVEGLATPTGQRHPIQEAFADAAAFQCGYCTGGMMMLAKALLDSDPDPSRATVAEWISANVCRCTGYAMIIEAVLDAARRMRGAAHA